MFISLLLQERNPLHVTLVAENLQDQTRRKDTPKFTPSPGPRRPRALPLVTRGADDDHWGRGKHCHHPHHGHLSLGCYLVRFFFSHNSFSKKPNASPCAMFKRLNQSEIVATKCWAIQNISAATKRCHNGSQSCRYCWCIVSLCWLMWYVFLTNRCLDKIILNY